MHHLSLEHTALDTAIVVASQSPKNKDFYVRIDKDGGKEVRIPALELSIRVYADRSGTNITKGAYKYTNALMNVVGDNKGSKGDDTLWLDYSTFFQVGDHLRPIPGIGERYIKVYDDLKHNNRDQYDCRSRYPKNLEQLKTIAAKLNIPPSISWNKVCNEALPYLLPHKNGSQ